MTPAEIPPEIDRLIRDLASDHGAIRKGAREAPVSLGTSAIGPLKQALEHPKWRIRWGATKALGQLRDPGSASDLVGRLEDERSGVRWLAAEGLIALGREGLRSLLRALMEGSDLLWLREGAHHVIHDLVEKDPELSSVLAPVATALNEVEPAAVVPFAAERAIRALETTTRPPAP